MLSVSHPTGNANVRAVLASLDEHCLLQAFCTTLAVQPEDWLVKLLPARLRRQVSRRGYALQHGKVYRFSQREIVRHLARILHIGALTQQETGWASVDAVYRDLDRQTARQLSRPARQGSIHGVYCYEDGALETFRAAKKLGLICIYDLPIAYWETARHLLNEEAQRWPEWEPTLVGTRDSDAKLERKTQELALADVVLTPSRFVYDSLPANARARKACHVVEFGSPAVAQNWPQMPSEKARPLRVLFVGSMTQRKGLADLFAALKLLKRTDVELVVMGTPVCSLDFYKAQYADFRYEPPRPHHAVLDLMRSCDVFALPSIVEGRALVQQEAMACGLPLLVTANAGGEDLIDGGETGFLVPIRAPQALAEKIAWFADHRAELPQMKRAAAAKAAEYTWERYGQRIVEIVRTSIVDKQHEHVR